MTRGKEVSKYIASAKNADSDWCPLKLADDGKLEYSGQLDVIPPSRHCDMLRRQQNSNLRDTDDTIRVKFGLANLRRSSRVLGAPFFFTRIISFETLPQNKGQCERERS